jgi:hypothetical protein
MKSITIETPPGIVAASRLSSPDPLTGHLKIAVEYDRSAGKTLLRDMRRFALDAYGYRDGCRLDLGEFDLGDKIGMLFPANEAPATADPDGFESNQTLLRAGTEVVLRLQLTAHESKWLVPLVRAVWVRQPVQQRRRLFAAAA